MAVRQIYTESVFDPKCLNTEECGGTQIGEIAESDLNFLIASLMEILKLRSCNDLIFCHYATLTVLFQMLKSGTAV